jgi:proton glutamate symport protein
VLVRWIIALAPIGVFALMLALGARMGTSGAGALGYYVILVSVLLAAQALLLYPLARLAGGVSVTRFARAALPAQAVAVSTRSSLAALPALVDGAEQVLRLPPAVAGFVLPLAVSVFKFSAPLSSVVGTLFVARLYQVDLTSLQVAFVALAAVALSFSTPGIPAGNLVVLAPVFGSLGLPLEGLGVLIALDVIPDTIKTTGNVTANLAVATIVARSTS